jgi:type II secretory pathway pseudopilin PulG
MREMQRNRAALTLPEVILVAAICLIVALFLLSRLPRGREQARAVTCLSNLNQIGQTLGFFVQSEDAYPTVAEWAVPNAEPGTSILFILRNQANLSDFVNVNSQIDPKSIKKKGERPAVPAGLRCPADRTFGQPAASNYRANTGADSTGTTGPFAIGKRIAPAQIESGDGLAFTAAFAERLIGSGTTTPGMADYVEVDKCDDFRIETLTSPGAKWRFDAGHDWSRGDWTMSLYQHGIRPNATNSVVALQERCANMGSSSGHLGLVHVLLLDGSARSWRTTVDENVWRKLGSFTDAGKP